MKKLIMWFVILLAVYLLLRMAASEFVYIFMEGTDVEAVLIDVQSLPGADAVVTYKDLETGKVMVCISLPGYWDTRDLPKQVDILLYTNPLSGEERCQPR